VDRHRRAGGKVGQTCTEFVSSWRSGRNGKSMSVGFKI
jgi:hypothetical protein